MKILVPIANGTEEMEATMIIDILRRAKANVVVASVEDELEIVASRKVKLIADMLLDEAVKLQYDLILLPVSSSLQFWPQKRFSLKCLGPLILLLLAGWPSWGSSIFQLRKIDQFTQKAGGIW